MSKNISTNKFNFIDFLEKEFGINSVAFDIKIEKREQPQSVKSQHISKFKWFAPQQPRSLENVLDIKLGAMNGDVEQSINNVDLEDESVDLWHKNFSTNKKYLLSQKRKKVANKNNFFIEFFNRPYFNIPGIFSYCREDENANESPNWLNKSVAFVFAVFILAVFSSAYLINNGKIENKNIATDIAQEKAVILPDKTTLANYVKTNRQWLQEQFSNQNTVAIKAEDILGKVAGAEEFIDASMVDNEKELLPEPLLGDKYNAFLNNFYDYFKNLEDKQKDASLFLSNSVANIVSR